MTLRLLYLTATTTLLFNAYAVTVYAESARGGNDAPLNRITPFGAAGNNTPLNRITPYGAAGNNAPLSSIAPSAGTTPITTSTSTPPSSITLNGSNGVRPDYNWDKENKYWKENYTARPYYNKERPYSSYEAAYRYGVALYNKNMNTEKPYEQLDDAELSSGWEQAKGADGLSWAEAQPAVRDAYNHMLSSSRSNAFVPDRYVPYERNPVTLNPAAGGNTSVTAKEPVTPIGQ